MYLRSLVYRETRATETGERLNLTRRKVQSEKLVCSERHFKFILNSKISSRRTASDTSVKVRVNTTRRIENFKARIIAIITI